MPAHALAHDLDHDLAYDDTLLADADADFASLDRAVAVPVPGDFEIMLLIDELVDELLDAAEKQMGREPLEISLTIEVGAEVDERSAQTEVAEVA